MSKYSAQGVSITAKQVKIEGKTKKFKGGEEARIKIVLFEDHPSWNEDVERWENTERPGEPAIGKYEFRDYKVCEDRKIPADRLQVVSTVNGDKVDATWDLTWPDTNVETEKEKYAVIRAEYYFLEKGAEKLEAKSSSNGVDSLFLGNKKIIICESKCSINGEAVSDYNGWLARSKDMTQMLGASTPGKAKSKKGGRELKVHPKKKVNARLMQMSWMWVYSIIEELTAKSEHPRLKSNWEGISSLMEEDKSCVERWFNFYGYDSLYVVPGKYHIRGARFAEISGEEGKHIDPSNEIVIDWPGDPWVEKEFQNLDEYKEFIDREDNNWNTVVESAKKTRLGKAATNKRAAAKARWQR